MIHRGKKRNPESAMVPNNSTISGMPNPDGMVMSVSGIKISKPWHVEEMGFSTIIALPICFRLAFRKAGS